MRIAIVSDIHENFSRLEQAVNTLQKHGYDMLICLGDITGFSPRYYDHQPDANACIDLLREKATFCIAGNHDLFTAQRLPSYHRQLNIPPEWCELSLQQRNAHAGKRLWIYPDEVIPLLSPVNREYLQGLPEWKTLDCGQEQLFFSHFLQPDLCGVMRKFPQHFWHLNPHLALMKKLGCRIAFAGHAHPNTPLIANTWLGPQPFTSKQLRKSRQQIILCPPIAGTKQKCGLIIFDPSDNLITSINIA